MREKKHGHSTSAPPIQLRDFASKIRGEKMLVCRLCGTEYIRICILFTSGSVEPQEDEVLTGASSGATGTVEEVVLASGSWAGGDAAGEVYLSGPTGQDTEQGSWGTDDEDINGSVGGAAIINMTTGILQLHAIRYPLSFMEKFQGAWYCRPHAEYKRRTWHKLKDPDNYVDATELESKRGELPE